MLRQNTMGERTWERAELLISWPKRSKGGREGERDGERKGGRTKEGTRQSSVNPGDTVPPSHTL